MQSGVPDLPYFLQASFIRVGYGEDEWGEVSGSDLVETLVIGVWGLCGWRSAGHRGSPNHGDRIDEAECGG